MQRLSGVLRQRVDGQKGAPTDFVPERTNSGYIVSLFQIILSQIRGGFRVRTFADPYGDQRRGLKCGAGTCQYPMCEACWNETMESCPQCRRVPNPYGRRTKRWGTLKPHPSTPHLPSSFFSYTDTPTVALIPPVGKSVNWYFDRMLTNSASQTVDGVIK